MPWRVHCTVMRAQGPPTPWADRPTLLSRTVLGADGARQAWRYVQEAFLDNPLPAEMRTALVCAAWEGPGMSTLGIHATGMSLLGQDDPPMDLAGTWTGMLDQEPTRALLAVTIHVANGHDVPPDTVEHALAPLGDWRRGWQALVVYAAWVDRLYRTHATEVIPLESQRMEPWLERLVQARGTLDRIQPGGPQLDMEALGPITQPSA